MPASFPSVTRILDMYSDFSRIPPELLQSAALRGTKVHQICCAIALGLWTPRIPEECAGYVESFRGWFESTVESVILMEELLIHRALCYKGHPDLICRLRGDKGLSLIDFKTPRAHHLIWRLQLGGYKGLALVNGYHIERTFTLRLNPTGKPPIPNEYTRTSDRDLAVFMACRTVYDFLKEAA